MSSHAGSVPIRIDCVVAIHWVLATLLSLPVIPFFLSDHANAMFDAIDAADIGQVTTSYLFALKALKAVPDVWPLVLVCVAHPFTPTIAAFLIAGFVIKRGSVRELFNRYQFWRGMRWKRGLTIWFIAVSTAAVLSLLSAAIGLTFVTDESFAWHAPTPISSAFWVALLGAAFIDGGGVAEEGGWRGFVLPLLQAKHSPVIASIILGTLWAVWHLPVRLQFFEHGLLDSIPPLFAFTLGCIVASINITYFSNRVGGTALMGVMLHGMTNDSVGLGGSWTGSDRLMELWAYLIPHLVLAVALIVVTRGKLGISPQSIASYTAGETLSS